MKLTALPLLLSLTACTFVTDDDWNAFDADGDGYFVNAEGVGEDCDDQDPAVNPDATESCNEIDDDCDGVIDNDVLTTFYVDADSDGWGNADFSLEACTAPDGYVADNTDCDDGEALSYPDAPELCDDEDNDCDGDTDEPEDIAWLDWYRDSDGDTYGDPDDLLNDCAQPTGFVADATDCDDSDAAVHPAADELCDRIDNDCDELTDLNDPDLVGDWTWHQDADGDGHGDPATAIGRCDQPTGYVLAGDDCDDSRGTIHPDAVELCGGLDDDCDGLVDEADPDLQGTATFYLDGDADGYGLASGTASGCTAPLGYAALSGDCNDSDTAYHPGASETDCHDPADYNCDGSTGYADLDGDGWVACEECDDGDTAAHPGATELCDGRDNDCDGTVDEDDADDAPTWYADADSDGFGDPAASARACSVPTGFVSDATDCDDARSATHPGALEWCNGHDDNCDGTTDEDEAIDAPAWYADADSDGYGVDTSTDVSCEAPDGFAALPGDCDDADSAYNPGVTEDDCGDLSDYNCDGATGYTDADGDGWAACEECDDSDARINPDATEVCDGVDDDCDGIVDEADAEDALTWYADADGDGYGDAAAITDACSAPSGTVPGASDCDDSDAATHPGALEYCDGHDDDCDGVTDEDDAADAPTWYGDADGDGYGEPTTTTRACAVPSGFAEAATDCDDGATATYPGATEWCDGVDTDCDGTLDEDDAEDATTWYADMDGDAHGDPDATVISCLAPPSFVTDSTDCDDGAAAVNPAATELCDGVDDDCDGTVDEDDAADAPTWYADVDGDGYGDAGDTTAACSQPSAFVADDADCDDWDATIHPGADEYCDGGDDDCDGSIDENDAVDALTWYADADVDGYGDPATSTTACSIPSGFLADSEDCNDGDAAVHPGADEYCDGVDEDCDGTVDNDAVDATEWYVDGDGDGYGDASTTALACSASSGLVTDATDCDDEDADVYPGADEQWNGMDDDCDGEELQVVQLSASAYHSMALLDDGTVLTWGLNVNGQLGDGTTTSRRSPAEVDSLADVEQVFAGGHHSLALLEDGSVWAWGHNSSGQIGDGTTTASSDPIEVAGISNIVDIAAGDLHSLALLSDGTVWAWGANDYGQLGDGTTSDSGAPVEVSGLSGVVKIAAGASHSLAILDDGTARAWGLNSSNQLGDGTTTSTSTSVQVSGISGVAGITAGTSHSLALLDNGTAYAWGYNNYGQVGDGSTTTARTPEAVEGISGAEGVSASGSHSMAWLADGTAWAWGYNSNGELGDSTTVHRSSPVELDGLTDVSALQAGGHHSLALTEDGSLWSWGGNSYGQLGDPSLSSSESPVLLRSLTGIEEIAVGYDHALARTEDGDVLSWGRNSCGELGDGTTLDSTAPVDVAGIYNAIAVAAGSNHSLALLDDGSVWSWGCNPHGELGDGTTNDSANPIEVVGISGVVSIKAGPLHSLALLDDGTVWSWGYNYIGELGDGSTDNRTSPVEVTGLTGVVDIAAGSYLSLGLLDDGSMLAWGYNYAGQLGDGTTTNSSTPVEVGGLSDVVGISAGNGFSMCLLDDGTVRTWGSNGNGQLGDGTTVSSIIPVEVTGVVDVMGISSGNGHALALLDDGTIRTWGSNYWGQLGDGSVSESTTSVVVDTLESVVMVSGSLSLSHAVLDDGTVYGWGDSSNGLLGFDTWSPQPVAYPE